MDGIAEQKNTDRLLAGAAINAAAEQQQAAWGSEGGPGRLVAVSRSRLPLDQSSTRRLLAEEEKTDQLLSELAEATINAAAEQQQAA